MKRAAHIRGWKIIFGGMSQERRVFLYQDRSYWKDLIFLDFPVKYHYVL